MVQSSKGVTKNIFLASACYGALSGSIYRIYQLDIWEMVMKKTLLKLNYESNCLNELFSPYRNKIRKLSSRSACEIISLLSWGFQ